MDYIQNFSQLKKYKPVGIRGALRNVALDGLSFLDKMTTTEAFLRKPRIQFLYIHHVFRDEEEPLRRLVQRLSKDHTFISYSDAITKLHTGTIDKSYVVISSDDGFKNNLRAAEILTDFGISACFFINPWIINVNDFATISQYCKEKLNFPPVEFLNWSEVDSIKKMGHEIGSHTMTHLNIGTATKGRILSEVDESHSELVVKVGEAKHFAFPYGRFNNFNEVGREIVFKTGFISCATAERGCHTRNEIPLSIDKFCILRDHIILDWNIEHIIHFLTTNSKNINAKNNLFPY
jgi:peptidoglycan/xylan/chitin deacetylase (PgdA/CDA1 family)